jgi:hypothetical protein
MRTFPTHTTEQLAARLQASIVSSRARPLDLATFRAMEAELVRRTSAQ